MKKIKFFSLVIMAILLCGPVSAKRYGLYCFFDTSEAVFEDDNVRITVVCTGDCNVELVAQNKSSKIIYVDKAASFFYENEIPQSLFTNATYTSGSVGTTGGSVNLGAIGKAMGVGGAVGTALGVINVGGSSSNSSYTTTFEQRVLAMAPGGIYFLCKGTINNKKLNSSLINVEKRCFLQNYEKFGKGVKRHYTVAATPLSYRGVINYSHTENFDNPVQISAHIYISDIVNSNQGALKNGMLDVSKAPECSEFQNQTCFYTVPNRTPINQLGCAMAGALCTGLAVGGVAGLILLFL